MDPKAQKIEAKNTMVRISPRKLRLVADTVRGKDALVSVDTLQFLPKKGSIMILKVLKSAMANAEHNFNLRAKDLYVKEIRVDEGPTYKRFRAVSRGRGRQILKRTARISITLGLKK